MDWYPWGAEAFGRAAAEDKPVFLSIGYSTCHWCHVMARESFENERIAKILNAHFVPVKVDREERPDIDSVYMEACIRMTGQGGWPLTILLTPEKKPFFAGTYFPPESRAGMTGLGDLLQRVVQLWADRRDDLYGAADQVAGLLGDTGGEPSTVPAEESLLREGFLGLAASFDATNGGFGRAPKFPSPATILFLLRYGKRTGSAQALSMAETTLRALSYGGIRDHIGGGFHRYSTDAKWRIPHFEKMLYDQALLLQAFTEAWLATRDPLFKTIAEEIISYAARDLRSPDGAFISAEDADSPGGEGAYYLWTRQDLTETLGEAEARFAADVFGVTDQGNFPAAEPGPGRNVLYLARGDPVGTGDPSRISAIREALFQKRKERAPPGRDAKVLADWNALMIGSLALASRAFSEPSYAAMAEKAAGFILEKMRAGGSGICHRWCDGEASVPAFADDYAFLAWAFVEMYETTFDPAWLERAIVLEKYLSTHFADEARGGFFTIPDTGEQLIVRKKEIHDGAVPPANARILGTLVALGHITGDPAFEERASLLAGEFAGIVRNNPSASCGFLCGLDYLLGPAMDVVITGREEDPVTMGMVAQVRSAYLPTCTVLFRSDRTADALGSIAPFTRDLGTRDGKATAYVCSGRSCSAPVTDAGDLARLLGILPER